MSQSELTITVVPAQKLQSSQLARWSALQKLAPSLASPYFRPEFTLAVADVCDNVEVAVLDADGEHVGFFPFQRVRGNHAIPVGGLMSDYQGVILSRGIHIAPGRLLAACGLVSWHFTHLIADQPGFNSFHVVRSGSSYLDLSRGFEAYQSERYEAGYKQFFKRLPREARHLEKEIGPVRFEVTRDCRALDMLLSWKSQQYQRTRTTDIFRLAWTRPLMERIFRQHEPDFCGMLAGLYAGDRLISLNFGMRSGRMLHFWIFAYDSTLSIRHSPGHLLLLEMAKAANSAGIDCIDLGNGREAYKRFWASAQTPLAEGVVDRRLLSRLIKRQWIRTREWVRETPLNAPARFSRRLLRPVTDLLLIRAAEESRRHSAGPESAVSSALLSDVHPSGAPNPHPSHHAEARSA